MAHKNWTEIFNYFLGHEAVSYTDLSKKFGIPVGTIKYKASQEKWQEKRETLWNAANKRLAEEMTIKIVERNRQQADFGKLLQGNAAKAMASGKLEPKSAHQIEQWIRTGVAIERNALGMNTNTNAYAVFRTEKEFITFVTRMVEAVTGGKQIKINSSKTSQIPENKVLPDSALLDNKTNTPAKLEE